MERNRMRKTFFVFLFVFACAGFGCQLPNINQPETIHYPKPELQVDFAVFEQAGCIRGEYNKLDCSSVPTIAAMECDQIYLTGDLLGGLDPNLPLAQCEYIPYRHDQYDLESFEGTYLFNSGCSMAFLVRYLVPQEGGFTLVHNLNELAEIFAPIETPEEALSYAIAATGLTAVYDTDLPRSYRFLVDKIEDTHVDHNSAGYEVFLYDDYLCGCGPHTVSLIRVQVTPDGKVSLMNPVPVYEDPKNDDLCID
jgi:hypothetical protein